MRQIIPSEGVREREAVKGASIEDLMASRLEYACTTPIAIWFWWKASCDKTNGE